MLRGLRSHLAAALRGLNVRSGRVPFILTAAAVLIVGRAHPARPEGAVFVGACTLTVEVAYAPVIGRLSGPRSLDLDGTGTCVVNDRLAPLVFQGDVSTTALTGGYGCAGGLATGTGVVDINTPGFPDPLVQLTVIDSAGAVTMTAVKTTPNVYTFEGIAELVRDPTDSPTCLVGSLATTTWAGVFVFQDPELVPPA